MGGINGFMAALIATLWAYDGWNDLTMVAGEVRRPERSLPVALIGGKIFDSLLEIASGRRTCAERLGHKEFVPWRIGPVL